MWYGIGTFTYDWKFEVDNPTCPVCENLGKKQKCISLSWLWFQAQQDTSSPHQLCSWSYANWLSKVCPQSLCNRTFYFLFRWRFSVITLLSLIFCWGDCRRTDQISSYSSSKILLNTFWQNMTGNKYKTSVQRLFLLERRHGVGLPDPLFFNFSSDTVKWISTNSEILTRLFFRADPYTKEVALWSVICEWWTDKWTENDHNSSHQNSRTYAITVTTGIHDFISFGQFCSDYSRKCALRDKRTNNMQLTLS